MIFCVKIVLGGSANLTKGSAEPARPKFAEDSAEPTRLGRSLEPLNVLKWANVALLESLKLISRKIRVTRKLCHFHSVLRMITNFFFDDENGWCWMRNKDQGKRGMWGRQKRRVGGGVLFPKDGRGSSCGGGKSIVANPPPCCGLHF